MSFAHGQRAIPSSATDLSNREVNRLRFGVVAVTGGPPDEWHADLTVGLKPAPGVMLMIQDFTTVSSVSTNRSFPAWRMSVVEASVVIALDNRWSVQFGLFTSVWAVKTNTQHGVALAVWRTF